MPLTYLQKSTKMLLRHSRVFSTINKKKSEYDVEDEKWFAEKLSSYETFKDPKSKAKEKYIVYKSNHWFIP